MEVPLEAMAGCYLAPYVYAGVIANVHVWQDSGQLLLSCQMLRVCWNCCWFKLCQDAMLGSSIPTFRMNSTTFDPSIPLKKLTMLWEDTRSDSTRPGRVPWLICYVERFHGTEADFSLTFPDRALPQFFWLTVSCISNDANNLFSHFSHLFSSFVSLFRLFLTSISYVPNFYKYSS